ncbi:RNA-binding protein MEX3D [Podarcis lilfordi]|uniref:RNA-binding protein MEX3D n=1 Tax=Podarcis lilfordi TaxID=74358 RepID=A0AA35PUZ3_9SAUR|nr:RNA-binding protein MEX3D [Podarcis lilfordi]
MPSALYQLEGGPGTCCPPPGLGSLLLNPQILPPACFDPNSILLPKGDLSEHPSSPPAAEDHQRDEDAEDGDDGEEEEEDPSAALRFALDQLSILGLAKDEEEEEAARGKAEEEGRGGEEEEDAAAQQQHQHPEKDGDHGPLLEEAEGLDRFAYAGGAGGVAAALPLLGPEGGSAPPPPEIFGAFPAHLGPPHAPQPPLLAGQHLGSIGSRKRSVNMTECVSVPSSEHVAEIVGRQGCKIKALRAKTNTYIKTPVRGEEPVFIVTGRKEDVEMAKREILSAAEHFSMIRATRNKASGTGGSILGPPNLPGQTTIQVRVPYRVVGLVVGPKGATIKRIQQQTHTYIVTPSRDKEPVFEVTGMPENVDRAREEIEAHITMRTGSFVDVNADNDFHSNGTDVCLDLLSGGPSSLWSKAPNPARRALPGLRSDTSPAETYFGGPVPDGAPSSPFGGGSGSFPFSDALGSDDGDFAFDFLPLELAAPAHIWSPFEPPADPLQAFSRSSSSSHSGASQRRKSTPRHSPTFPEAAAALEHPLARRIPSDPVSAVPWLPPQGSLSSFSNSTGYSSSSSSLPGSLSAASGSPTDSTCSEGPRKASRECMVCFESEVIAALVPCGHNLFCMECAMRICGRSDPECPACHTPATQAIHIFS